jgi:hypothetical protein
MAIELGGITLQHLTSIAVRERARIARHPVPGMKGDLAQIMGRPSVEVSFHGIFYGRGKAEELSRLRSGYLQNQPVDFFTEAVGEGYFSQVLIAGLEVSQRAGSPDQFDFTCKVVEYVEPPTPVVADPLAALDTELLDEAAGLVDEAQNALKQVAQLADVLGLVPDFGNPTAALTGILDEFENVAGEATASLSTLSELF